MSDHADDLGLDIKSGDMDMLTDRVLVGKIGACENVVDVDHCGRVLVVLLSDEAAALQRDAHGLLEAIFHQVEHGLRHIVIAGGLGLALDPEGQIGIVDHRAGAEGDGDGFDAGDGAHIGVELAQASAGFGRGGSGIGGQRQGEGDGVSGIVAGIHAPESGESAQHQSRADEEHESHGDFGGDEEPLQAVARAARPRPLPRRTCCRLTREDLERGARPKTIRGEKKCRG